MIPQDLLVEILLKLHVKTLGRCQCVSKLWVSIIRSRRFIELYQSIRRQSRVMFAFRDIYSSFRWHFFSSSQPSSSVTNAIGCIDTCASRNPECVNGLICFRYMHRLWICNPVTAKEILLPPPSTFQPYTAWFMGYDPINYQYKVLYFSRGRLSVPYTLEVFALLGDQSSWKMVEDENVQAPVTRGICIDGVVYYGSELADKPRITRFDVRTEKFVNSIELPAEARNIYGTYLSCYIILNYQGRVALLATKTMFTYDLWVLEDAEKQEWSRVAFVITREICPLDLIWPGLVGFVAGSDELIITARDRYDQFYLVYIDLKKKRSRQVLFEGIRCGYGSSGVLAFTDYVESIILM